MESSEEKGTPEDTAPSPAATPPPQISARAKRLARLIVVFGSLLFLIGALELVASRLYYSMPNRNGRRIVDSYMGRKSEVPATIVPHPYLLYANAPNFNDGYAVQHNSLGYRNAEFPVKKPPGQIRVLALGGSTTHVWPFIRDRKDSWVALLEKRLREQTGKDVFVINGGIPYGTSPEMLAGWVFRHRFLDPDVVIFHEGGNDIIPLMLDNYDPEYTHFRFHGNGTEPRPGERTLLKSSRLARFAYGKWLDGQRAVYRSEPAEYDMIDREKALPRVLANPSEGFRRNLDYLVELIQKDGHKAVLFGFLQQRKEKLANKKPSLKGLEEALDVGLKKHYAIMREIAKNRKIPFVEPNQDLFKDEWFLDNCHVNKLGEVVKADILAEVFKREHLLDPDPPPPPALQP